MVRLLLPSPPTVAAPDAVTDRSPWVSASVAVKVSVPEALDSLTLTPAIVAALLIPISCAPGTAMTGPFTTDTAIDFCTAALPTPDVLSRLSVAFTVIVSAASVESVSLSLATAAFTCASDP